MGLVAPPWVPVPPVEYGGTELVVAELATGLQAAGAEVVLFATGDSTCPVPLRWHHPRALGTEYRPAPELLHVEAAYRALRDADIVHDHTMLGPHWARKHHVQAPVVTTVHGPFEPRLAAHYQRLRDEEVHVVGISRAQAATAPAGVVQHVIHHGLDPARYPLGEGQGGYAVFLGRISEDKGPHRAIEVARQAGLPIRLAAKVQLPEEHRFFTEVVEPLLGPDATFLGEVGHEAKVELLQGAAAMVNPIRWDEPFGLVMVEAMLCGTPVLAHPYGAATELVEEGVTGSLGPDEGALAEALARVDHIDRARCRARAVARFSAQRMVADHLALYRSITDADRRAATHGGGGPTPISSELAPRRGAGSPPRPWSG